jgi:hypothetical protein
MSATRRMESRETGGKSMAMRDENTYYLSPFCIVVDKVNM